jgi:DNA-binding ferritin-like protein
MADFVKFFFELQNTIKLYHWNTTSFARHKGADDLVESVIDLSDKFMEVYMGKYGRPNKSSSKTIAYSIKHYTDKEIVEYIKTSIKTLDNLSQQISPKDTDLLNIRDEVLGKLNQTLYLFTLN